MKRLNYGGFLEIRQSLLILRGLLILNKTLMIQVKYMIIHIASKKIYKTYFIRMDFVVPLKIEDALMIKSAEI